MAIMLPFAGLSAAQAWHRMRRAVPSDRARRGLALAAALAMLVVTAFGLLMTTSRGAWIALGCALLLAGLWAVAGVLTRRRAAYRAWAFLGLVAAGLVMVVTVALAWPGGMAGALAAIPGGETGVDRLGLLRYTPTLVRDYPFVGAGLGGFQMLYSTYALLIHVGYTVHSHNLYLNVAVEQGLVALGALAWMWLLFAVAVWRGIVRPGSCQGAEALGAALCVGRGLVHGLADDVLYGSRGLLLMFVPLAFAVPYFKSRRAAGSRKVGWAVPLAITLFLLLCLIWRDGILSRIHSNLGAVHQSRAELSVYTWPEFVLQDDVRRQVNLARPVAEFERALAFDPGNGSANRRLGMIELALGRYEAALGHLQAAYAADPGSITARQLLGEALIANGRQDEGRALWAGVNNEQGQSGRPGLLVHAHRR
jgi:hypothetical protein